MGTTVNEGTSVLRREVYYLIIHKFRQPCVILDARKLLLSRFFGADNRA